MLAHIQRIEALRESRLLVLAASHLEIELLPQLYEQCREIGRVPRLDILLHGKGGEVHAARRIALLLRAFGAQVNFIVPYYCESAATLLALSGSEIIAGDLAIFTPIDPHLQGSADDSAPDVAMSSQDVRLFGDMSEAWFGVAADEARQQSLGLLCNSVFPPTLTAFYRTTQELQQIGEELIAYQLPASSVDTRRQIVEQLAFGYHSHGYPLTGGDLARLGLNVHRHAEVEEAAWAISRHLQAQVGGGARASLDAPRVDALIATRHRICVRERHPEGFNPQWTEAAGEA